MTVLVLLLGAGMVSASEAGSDVQVVKDNQGLSTPDNYDVDNVVQSDKVLTKSEANVEKTSTKDDTKNNNESYIDTFVDTDNTNEDLQTIASGSGHSAKVSVNEISGRTLNIAGLENSGLLQETIDVNKISINSYDSLASSEDMTPILTGETTDSSGGLVDTNTKSNVKSQETDKTIEKADGYQDVKAADGDPIKKVRATVRAVFDDFNNKYNSRPTSTTTSYTYTFKRGYSTSNWNSTNGSVAIKPTNGWTNQTILLDMNRSNGQEYVRFNLTAPTSSSSKPAGYLPVVITNTSRVYQEIIDGVTYEITQFDYIATYTLQNITLQAYKTWNDSGNPDKLRPANFTWGLFINDTLNDTYYTNASSTSTSAIYSQSLFSRTVPVIDSEGNELVYTLQEIDVPEDYTVTYLNTTPSARTYRLNMTNTRIVKWAHFNVSIEWDDNNDQDGKRGTSYQTVYIRVNGNSTTNQTQIRLYPANDWTNITNKSKFVNGQPANFTIYYPGKSNYNCTITNITQELESGDILYNVKIKMTHIPEIRNITLEKIWKDYNNKDNLRPNNITVNFLRNGILNETIVLNDENNWNHTFENLPAYEAGTKIQYGFEEVNVPEPYISSMIYQDYWGECTITNSYVTQVDVNVTWNDTDNLGSPRPTNLVINLLANGNLFKAKYVSEVNNWKYSFTELPIYDDDGNKIVYTVEQDLLPDYYAEEIQGNDNSFNILNSYKGISMNISKYWDDDDDFDGFRPDEIEVQVLTNGEVYKNIILSENNNWTCEVTGLPKYIDGELVTFTINENVPDKYVAIYNVSNEKTIKDIKDINIELYSLTEDCAIYKVYVTNGSRDIVKGGTITIVDADGEVLLKCPLNDDFVTFTKPLKEIELEWRSYNGRVYGPYTFLNIEKFAVDVTYSDVNGSFTTRLSDSDVLCYNQSGLYVRDPFNMGGIWAYCIDGTDVDDPVSPSCNLWYVVRDGSKFSVPYYKVALTDEEIHNLHDDSVVTEYLKLLIYNHIFDGENFTLDENGLCNGFNFEYLFNCYLGDYYYTRNKIIYNDPDSWDSWMETYWPIRLVEPAKAIMAEINALVEEGKTIPNHGVYNTTSEGTWIYQFYILKQAGECDEIYMQQMLGIDFTFIPNVMEYEANIINTHYPSLVNISVTKNWNDSDNQDGIRPECVVVELLADGNSTNQIIKLDESNNWTGNFTDLPEYKNGIKIVYTFNETPVPNGYDLTFGDFILKKNETQINLELLNITKNDDNTGTAKVQIVVKDKYNSSVSEGNIVVTDEEGNIIDSGSLIDGMKVVTIPISFVPEESPLHDDSKPGIKFNITVRYEENDLYFESNETFTDITDSFIYAIVERRTDGKTPGEPFAPWYFSDGVWTFCLDPAFPYIQQLDVHDPDYLYNSDEMPYIKVDLKEGMDLDTDIYDVLNCSEHDKNALKYIKTLLYYFGDELNVPGPTGESYLQPIIQILTGFWGNYRESSEYTLIVNFTYDSIQYIDYVFELPDLITHTGKPLSYYVNETVRLVDNGFEVPNNGVKNITDDGRWEYQFYLYCPYNYYFGEFKWQRMIGLDYTFVPREKTLLTNLTNTHIPENVTINVTKVWNDSDNQDGIRPNNITVALYKGYELNDTFTLSEDNDWKHTFKDLPKYENGELIDYRVDEVMVPIPTTKGSDDVVFIHYVPVGYDLVIDEVSEYNFTFTNTHVPEKTNITVVKNWTDDNDKVNLRPNHIVVKLYANGEELGNPVILSEDNNWEGIFANLDVYCDGEKIEYTVVEDVPRNYTASYNYTMNITISHDNEFVLRGTRLSDDEGKVTYYLVADGDKIVDSVSISIKDYYDTIHWEFTFTDLPVYSENNELISYTINETYVEEPSFVAEVYVDYNMTCSYAVSIDNRITGNTTINVTKVWNDTNNNDGKRPDSVNITLVIDGVPSDQTVELKGPNYEGGFTDLPMYHENGTAIVYNVTEVERDVPEGYELSDIVFCEGRFKVINTHIPEVVNVTVNKVWNDVEDNDRVRPANVTVILLQNGEKYRAVVLNATGGWKYTFTDLPKYYDEGKEYVYNVTEVAVSGYTMSVSNNSAYNFTITNIHELELTELNVTKVWNDSDNQDGLRVPEVHVVLMDGDEEIQDTVLNAGNGWKDTFTELVKYRDGKLIEYTLVEDEVDDYDTEIVFSNGVFTVTNTHVPEVVNVTVNKVWNDSDNQDGIRPEEVTLKLKADGQEYTVKVVKSTDGKWNYTFTDLPKYSNGQEIVYTIEEVNIAKGYTVSYSDDTLSIVNTHVPEVTEVNVSKVWDDADDNDGKRPGSVTVDLLADGVKINETTLSSSNDWKATFKDLPVNKDGKAIVYTINESSVPAGYTVKVVFCEGVFKVVNSYIPENTTVTVVKVWEDNNDQDAVRPDSVTVKLLNGETVVQTAVISGDEWTYTFTGLPKYSNGQEIVYTVEEVVPTGYISNIDGTTIVNTHVPEVTEVNVSKVWDDAEDNDGKRPASVTVDLLADGVKIDEAVLSADNDWKATFNNLPVNKDGKAIVYTINESSVPAGYTVKVVFCEGVFKVVNSYIPENTSINVNKVWEDANNQDAIRPDAVFVSVLANGEEYKLVKLTGEDGWTVTVGGLPKYSNGKEIVYTVEEAGVPAGYTAVVDGLTITNTHVPEVISVNVSKVWKDNDNNDGVRPESVTVHLFADGKEVGKATLSEANSWKYTFDNLPLNSEGKPVTYTVSEDSVEGYSTSLVNCNGTFKFINTHDDSKVNITINKVWVDNEDQDNIRPENVTVEVLANGERYDVVVINSTSGWKITVNDLPEFVGGQKVVYTVREIRVETGYTSSVDGFTITNTHEPFTKEINVTKIWNDNNSSLRPESVTVHLMDGDNVVATVSLSAGNDWKATFKDLPVNRDGKAIVYTVKEVEVPDYTTEIKDCCGNFKIVNTPIVVPINITVNKVWDDNNNNDGIRPGSVTIRLLADGEIVEVAVITGDDWTYTFTDLPEYKDGKKVTYTVQEVEVPRGYVASVDGLTITNTHVDITKNITVSKFWDDDNNNDGKRPDSVTIRLLADGNEVAITTLSDDNDWKDTFTDLPVNKDGKEIVYNVTEDPVDPYVVSITNVDDEFIVTNSYNITKINLTIKKVWVDEDDNDGLRPDNITVILYANGEELVAAVVNEDNDWTYTFSDLQKYNNGYLIEYTIDELPVEEYVAVVDGLTITNTHDIITKDIPVSKVWVDDNNNDGTRPDSVTINLYAFGRKVSSISITEADGWEGVFKDLPVYIKGNEIVYTIVEESVPDYWVTYNGSMIINTHDLVNTSVTVTKVWNDSNNNDGVRPDSVSVNLYADGVKVSSIVLSSNNSWTHTFDKLPKYNDGQIIVYTVDEEVVGAYSVSITEDSNYFIIVNNYETKLINLTINKIWDDKDNYYGKRPVNVTVKVFADGEEIDSVVLSEENNWTCELNNLPKYDNGKLINYGVDEVNITYYHYSIESEDNYTFTVTNTLNKVRVFKWAWKLIGWNESYYERVEVDDNVPVVKRSSKIYAKGKGIGKYQPRYTPYKKNYRSNGKHYINRLMFREHYRLFIYLYNQYLYGNMTYSEFVALLQLNGIQIDESNAWDSNGTLIFDYDDLEDVPDSIGLHDNGGHVKDSSDRVEKYKPISNSGVIDSGEVEAEVFDVEE